MPTTAIITGDITMQELLARFPGAQRALFRRYHIGGCSSCGFQPDETLEMVCARNDSLNVDEVIEHILESDAADRAMMIEPRELASKMEQGESVRLIDVRTREEFDAVKIESAELFTQETMSKLQGDDAEDSLVVIYDHQGTRSLDAAAYFQGHGLKNVKALRGGIDAWSQEVDPDVPRYHIEQA